VKEGGRQIRWTKEIWRGNGRTEKESFDKNNNFVLRNISLYV
jgi:hypothetical protein